MVAMGGHFDALSPTLPEGWEAVRLGQLAEFVTSGSRGWAAHYSDTGALFVRSQNVRDGFLDFTERQCVNPPSGSEGSRTRLTLGDLLITITGNSVGNVAWVDRDLNDAYISQHVGLVRLANPSQSEYVCRFLSSGSPGNRQIWASQSGQSKPGLNLRNLEDFIVSLPPLPEQRSIASALSDVDALIRSLDRLIAKKRNLKQAAMQQLLTGKTRLPGFEGEWAKSTLGELFTFKNGLNKSKEFFGNGTPIVNYMDAYKGSGIFSENVHGLVTVDPQELKNYSVQEGDVFFTRTSETVDEIGLASVMLDEAVDTVFSGFLLRARPRDSRLENQYKRYCFTSTDVRRAIVSQSTYTTRALTNGRQLSAVCVAVPALEEQSAIATVLSDMDAEIAALEARLAKTRALKQGMMQELLTGRTRLV